MAAETGSGAGESLPRAMTLRQVASCLGGMSVKTVRRMIDRGELPWPMRIGGRDMMAEADVREYIRRKLDERKQPA